MTNRPAHSNSENSLKLNPIETEALRSKFNVGVFFKHDVDLDDNEIHLGTESKTSTILNNGENAGCPQSHTKCSDIAVYFNEYDTVPRS
jgi:hypothetical protein